MLIQLRKQLYAQAIVAVFFLFFISCKKDIDNTTTNPVTETPDLTTKVTASMVSGFVTDENNLPVFAASVKVGNISTSTNQFGYFEVKNVEVVKTAATVTVIKPGYFKGIKTYGAVEGKDAFFRIKLIPKIIAGTISGSAGGNISLTNGLVIALPANAVVNTNGNTPYTGTINVATHWLDPTADDLGQTMPGDLRAINNDNVLQGLTTFGMVAVELTGASGELLQIATGKKATLTIPLPAAITSAPASIPLWYFDETKGLWIEEGTATKTGNSYTGDVSHFSFWNCDIQNAIVPLTFTIVDVSGNPLGNVYVEMTPVGYPYGAGGHITGFTPLSGFVSTFLAPNTQYTFTVYDNCVNPPFSQVITVGTTALNLGNIVISGANTATVTGTVTDCNNAPVTNGYIVMRVDDYFSAVQPLSATGSFNFSTLVCSSGDFEFIGVDMTANQQSSILNYTLVSGTNAIGNLQACGISSLEFLNITVDGVSESYFFPIDSLWYYNSAPGPVTSASIGGHHQNGTSNVYTYSYFDNTGIAAGSSQPLTTFYSSLTPMVSITTPINVNITEYGAIGDFVAGSFSGTVTESQPPNTSHAISCNFRLRRWN